MDATPTANQQKFLTSKPLHLVMQLIVFSLCSTSGTRHNIGMLELLTMKRTFAN